MNPLPQIIQQYEADYKSLDRLLSAPFSLHRHTRLGTLCMTYLAELDALDFDKLPYDGQVDWLLFHADLTHETGELDAEQKRIEARKVLLPFLDEVCALEDTRRRREFPKCKVIAAQINGWVKQISALEKETPEAKATIVKRVIEMIGGLLKMLAKWYEYYHAYDPLFTWWVAEPYKALKIALESYAKHLKETKLPQTTDAIIGDPVGRDVLLADLHHDRIVYTPEELLAIAGKERAWCEAELVRAAGEMGFGDDWRGALEAVKERHVAPGEQSSLVLDLAEEAIAYVENNNLLTVPDLAKETWRMEMLSPEQQKTSPFFLGGETIYISYPTHDMPQDAKKMSLRGNNRHFARATVQHELVPGHHMQQFFQSRYKPYRRRFFTPFWTEGWTLHWEMLLWERGFGVTPEDRIGMLFWRLHRAVRVIFSLKFHLEEMTAEQCVELLIHGVGHEPANAEAEVRRSCGDDYPPLYQLAYLIGGLQMHALYHERVGAGEPPRVFHDNVLHQNCMPVELLRATLAQTPLTRDFPVTWRF
jgi:Bacterial protein of unknown function (DUF885)